ncbi:MAG: 16S rRNA (adenine(1518)-N(6)/adenine(1519)-N(6))-dimethyltransferase RsmA [Magnetococcales bacterium]|nr:16S rRNA (adenine(1518)-N(6)/adenine(1519)-N(6))-dimethyltransferase RsmA [Magnetococcales bacterium]
MSSPRSRLQGLLKAQGILPNKRLGQNFLVDPGVAERIVAQAGLQPGEAVVEIGPGLGSLTRPLLQRAGTVWCVERDARLIPPLRAQTAGIGELVVVQGDALEVDYRELSRSLGAPLRVVANLPYGISTPLLLHFLAQRQAFAGLTLMFQSEVARRMVAGPGSKTYGTLSVHCGLWAEVELLFEVPPEAFHPRPEVTSAVVGITLGREPAFPVADVERFGQVVRAAFGQRRKTLVNALKGLDADPAGWLSRADIDPRRRGETLTVAEFAALADPGLATPVS